jgi:hypothetical protein
MKKSEFYKKLIELYKSTGQGIPYGILPSNIKDIVDSLVKDGLVKLVTIHYSYLPNDVFVCLTGTYCVEEDSDKASLTYMRIYLNVEDLGLNTKLSDVKKDPKYSSIMKGYNEWLNKNKEELEKVDTLDSDISDEILVDQLSSDVLEYLKKLKCYRDNYSIQDSIYYIKDFLGNVRKQLELSNQLVSLYRIKKNYEKKRELEDSIDELRSEISSLESISVFLGGSPKDSTIQDVI